MASYNDAAPTALKYPRHGGGAGIRSKSADRIGSRISRQDLILHQLMRTYTSHGKTIEVTPRLFGIFLWIGFGFEVRIGDRIFLPKMDRFSWLTSTEFEFDADGKRVTGIVRLLAPIWFLPRARYSVTVSDAVIASDTQTLARWPLMYFGWLLVGMIVMLIVIGLLTVIPYSGD